MRPAAIQMEVVPNRECGECNACCTNLTIPELNKPFGVTCRHLEPKVGCKIYAARPAPCRHYFCLWRYMGTLGDQWRPDRSGVLGSFIKEVPPGYASQFSIRLQLIGAHDVVRTPAFAEFVAYAIRKEIPVFIVLSGEVGLTAGWAFLNENLKPAVMANNLEGIFEGLRQALEFCKTVPKEPLPEFEPVST